MGIGWLIDVFLIPGMERDADSKYSAGPINYNVAWILLAFLGVLGIHRMYIGKWITGIIWFFTGGLFTLGYVYDYWTWNEQVSDANRQ